MYVVCIHKSIFFYNEIDGVQSKEGGRNLSEEKKQQTHANFYAQTETEVVQALGTSTEGLTTSEVEKRLATYGTNELEEGKKKSLAQKSLNSSKI